MPSRFSLGRSTKASARLEALLRVMERLSSMRLPVGRRLGFGRRVLRFLQLGGRKATGFAQRRIAPPIVRMIGPTLAALATSGRAVAFAGMLIRPLDDERAAHVFGPFSDEKGPEEKDGRERKRDAEDQRDVGAEDLWGGFLRIFERIQFRAIGLGEEQE